MEGRTYLAVGMEVRGAVHYLKVWSAPGADPEEVDLVVEEDPVAAAAAVDHHHYPSPIRQGEEGQVAAVAPGRVPSLAAGVLAAAVVRHLAAPSAADPGAVASQAAELCRHPRRFRSRWLSQPHRHFYRARCR